MCKKRFGFYKISRVCSTCMFCSRLSANLPSMSKNMSATDFPVFLVLVKPFFLCVSPVCCNAPDQCLFLLLPPAAHPQGALSSCSIPGPAVSVAQPGHAAAWMEQDVCSPVCWLCLSAWRRSGLCPAFPCVAFVLSVAVAHRTGGALLYSTSSPSDKLGRNFGVSEGSSDRLL